MSRKNHKQHHMKKSSKLFASIFFMTLLIGIFQIVSCKKKETTPTPTATATATCSDGIQNQGETGIDCGGPCAACPITTIGANYGGGIVFYIDASGQHGFISAANDQSAGIKWGMGAGTTFIFQNPPQYGTTSFINDLGQSNTTYIVNYFGAGNYAAYLCDTLTLNGYNDWFLPSMDQLYNMGQNQQLYSTSFIFGTRYFSSSEGASNGAYEVTIGQGSGVGGNKNSLLHVRAARHF